MSVVKACAAGNVELSKNCVRWFRSAAAVAYHSVLTPLFNWKHIFGRQFYLEIVSGGFGGSINSDLETGSQFLGAV